MDKDSRALGQYFKKKQNEAEINIKRAKENFPALERKVDSISNQQKFRSDFHLPIGRHDVRLNLWFREKDKVCNLNQIDEYLICETGCSSGYGDANGVSFPASWPSGFVTNIGGFSFGPNGGVLIPQDGYYRISYVVSVGGVSLGSGSATASIEKIVKYDTNPITYKMFTLATETISAPTGGTVFYSETFTLMKTMVPCKKDNEINGYLGASGLAFYTPANLCLLFGGQPLIIELVGTLDA